MADTEGRGSMPEQPLDDGTIRARSREEWAWYWRDVQSVAAWLMRQRGVVAAELANCAGYGLAPDTAATNVLSGLVAAVTVRPPDMVRAELDDGVRQRRLWPDDPTSPLHPIGADEEAEVVATWIAERDAATPGLAAAVASAVAALLPAATVEPPAALQAGTEWGVSHPRAGVYVARDQPDAEARAERASEAGPGVRVVRRAVGPWLPADAGRCPACTCDPAGCDDPNGTCSDGCETCVHGCPLESCPPCERATAKQSRSYAARDALKLLDEMCTWQEELAQGIPAVAKLPAAAFSDWLRKVEWWRGLIAGYRAILAPAAAGETPEAGRG